MRNALLALSMFVAVCVCLAAGSASGPAPGPQDTSKADLGDCASLHGLKMFPPDNPWNKDISAEAVDPNSDRLIASMGRDKPLHPDFGTKYGIPYRVVSAKSEPAVFPQFQYKDESDRGPYPLPANAPIEGGKDAPSGSDRHVLILDRDAWKLYELYNSFPPEGGKGWRAGSGAIWDLKSNLSRTAGWTSADAAGLPILPGLVRYDEIVGQKELAHAVRFTCVKTRRGHVAPATHFASSRSDVNLPPMGMRVRLKASVDISGYPPAVQVILRGLKKYGMILADNGSDWFVSGSPHPQWDDEMLNTMKRIKGRDFEVIHMGRVTTK